MAIPLEVNLLLLQRRAVLPPLATWRQSGGFGKWRQQPHTSSTAVAQGCREQWKTSGGLWWQPETWLGCDENCSWAHARSEVHSLWQLTGLGREKLPITLLPPSLQLRLDPYSPATKVTAISPSFSGAQSLVPAFLTTLEQRQSWPGWVLSHWKFASGKYLAGNTVQGIQAGLVPYPGGKVKWLQTLGTPMQVAQRDRLQACRHRFYFSPLTASFPHQPAMSTTHWGSFKVKMALKPSLKFWTEPSVVLMGYHVACRPENATKLNAKSQLLPPEVFRLLPSFPLESHSLNIFKRRKKKEKFFELFFPFSWVLNISSQAELVGESLKHSTSMSLWEI